MTLTDLLLASLATYYFLYAWFKGSLFAEWRATLQATPGKLSEGLLCGVCASFHVALILPVTGVLLERGAWYVSESHPLLTLLWMLSFLLKTLTVYVPATAAVGVTLYHYLVKDIEYSNIPDGTPKAN